MSGYKIKGGRVLKGEVEISGAKNVALKAIAASFLTEDKVVIENAPLISDVLVMVEIAKSMGAKVKLEKKHRLIIEPGFVEKTKIPLEIGAKLRASSVFLGSLIGRFGRASIPNPGGCRIGARPIDRHIEGLRKLGANVYYDKDGYFQARAKKIKGSRYSFLKNTHTGTETLILAAVLGKGKTVLENAAQEPEVDDLIELLVKMGARIRRSKDRVIEINGVEKLRGAKHKIMYDRNEAVTMAVAGLVTKGRVLVKKANKSYLKSFLEKVNQAGAFYEEKKEGIEFYRKKSLRPTKVVTGPYPGFMTDWQAPWALLMTQADGESIVHETVYEKRFVYVEELRKMGARIEFFNPKVKNPREFYNFNWDDGRDSFHAIRICGPTKLHNAVMKISDLRAGATLVLAALAAKGESYIEGVEHIDRGYENFEERLKKLGANIKRVK